ncbi:L,D-transpeptidase family protein [Streptosporangium amethystogenes]|uniref:L,D-transpeptidase family protein n=1 Tax=Streptosporangium amethystogenes TaxID=2002 RepID=UPI00068E89AE|nr:L,D-transpeptidase family protein [Streptosporangium amethystogenes]
MRSTVHRVLIAGTIFALATTLPIGVAHAAIDPSPDFQQAPLPDQFTILKMGSRGIEVHNVKKRLRDLGFTPGNLSSTYDSALRMTVWAFQKANGLRPVDRIDLPTWQALLRPRRIRPLVGYGGSERAEIDLQRQLLTVWQEGKPVLVTHISTGARRSYCEKGHCGFADTPVGDYRVGARVPGWSTGILGSMFYSVYFNGGIAIHGSTLVPRFPASHGCVRVPLHNAVPLYRLLQPGDPVYVRRPEVRVERRPEAHPERPRRIPRARHPEVPRDPRGRAPSARPAHGPRGR